MDHVTLPLIARFLDVADLLALRAVCKRFLKWLTDGPVFPKTGAPYRFASVASLFPRLRTTVLVWADVRLECKHAVFGVSDVDVLTMLKECDPLVVHTLPPNLTTLVSHNGAQILWRHFRLMTLVDLILFGHFEDLRVDDILTCCPNLRGLHLDAFQPRFETVDVYPKLIALSLAHCPHVGFLTAARKRLPNLRALSLYATCWSVEEIYPKIAGMQIKKLVLLGHWKGNRDRLKEVLPCLEILRYT